MSDEKINVSWDELKSAKVEKLVKQQQAVKRNRQYAQMTPADVATDVVRKPQNSIWYNETFILALFGFIGGFLAWGCTAALDLRPDPRTQESEVLVQVRQIQKAMRPEQAQSAIDGLAMAYDSNPYVHIRFDRTLSEPQKQEKLAELENTQKWKIRLAEFIAFGLCGLFVSVCLSIAEPMVDHNLPATIVNGSVGALLGLLGGLAAMIVVERVYQAIGGSDDHNLLRHYAANAASWGVLGCFISAAPGVVTRNIKRLIIGIAGGAIGGILGGLAQGPVTELTNFPELGKLVGLVCIGVIAGMATSIIEQATRTGWLKVTSGLIAGKQFILYRNPTYLGSSPDCQIYLFRDPQVGRRHAAVHILKGRFELENLPLGTGTLVNGEEATRKRLRNGDCIKIGSTSFVFQEKNKANA